MTALIKALFFALLLWLGYYLYTNRQLLYYGLEQGRAEAALLLNTRSVHDCLQDPAFPDSLKQSMRLIVEIKAFAFDSLGLHGDTAQLYNTFYDQHGKPLMYMLLAAPHYRLEAHTWNFPVIGRFPYKGFFNYASLLKEQAELEAQGMETSIEEVAAFSTLGWLPEPILSSMLQRGPGGLSSLLIHELSHGFIFVPDSSGLNENLANFIGEEGAKLFLRHKYGPQSGRMQRNLYGKQDSRHYAEHLHRGSLQLDSLYNDPIFIACPTPKKEAAKQQLIDLIFRNLDTVAFSFPDAYCSRPANLNNNYFLSYRTYEFRQNAFRTEFEKLYPGNLPGYIAYLRKKYGGPNS